MANYHNVWGQTEKCWDRVDIRGEEILTILTVCAWGGMVVFFIAVAFVLITKNDDATIAMYAALFVWLVAGVSAIRIRRGRRKYLRIQL